jgi:hypothetical protein
MFVRLFKFKILLNCGLVLLILASCSKKDQPVRSSDTGFQSFSLVPGKDITSIDYSKHRISVRVPETYSAGSQLVASFAIPPGAS